MTAEFVLSDGMSRLVLERDPSGRVRIRVDGVERDENNRVRIHLGFCVSLGPVDAAAVAAFCHRVPEEGECS